MMDCGDVCQDNKYLLFLIVKFTCFSEIYVVDILKSTPPHPKPTRSVGLTHSRINTQNHEVLNTPIQIDNQFTPMPKTPIQIDNQVMKSSSPNTN